MSAVLPPQVRALLDGASLVTLATVNRDGSPHVAVLWATRDSDDVLLSTVVGLRKERNMRRDPRVALIVHDPERFVSITGTVTITTDGGRELIDRLARTYLGGRYPHDDGTDNVRVVVRLRPDHVIAR